MLRASDTAKSWADHLGRSYGADLEGLTCDMPTLTAVSELSAVARGDAEWIGTADALNVGDGVSAGRPSGRGRLGVKNDTRPRFRRVGPPIGTQPPTTRVRAEEFEMCAEVTTNTLRTGRSPGPARPLIVGEGVVSVRRREAQRGRVFLKIFAGTHV